MLSSESLKNWKRTRTLGSTLKVWSSILETGEFHGFSLSGTPCRQVIPYYLHQGLAWGGGSGLAAEPPEIGVCVWQGARPLLPRPAALSARAQLLYKGWRAQDRNILDTSIRRGNLA